MKRLTLTPRTTAERIKAQQEISRYYSIDRIMRQRPCSHAARAAVNRAIRSERGLS